MIFTLTFISTINKKSYSYLKTKKNTTVFVQQLKYLLPKKY